MRWTEEQLAEHMQSIKPNATDEPDDGKEYVLQGKIVNYAKEKGYPCLSFRQSKKAIGFLEPGWPDITLALPGGRVLFLELKAKKGTLRGSQREKALMFMQLGHEWHVVKSYKKFLSIAMK